MKRTEGGQTPEFHAHVRCTNCNELVYLHDAFKVEKILPGGQVTFYFCGETCANEYYLDKLREGGL